MMEQFFFLKPQPIKAISSFLLTSFKKRKNRKKFEKANFTFESFGKMDKPIQTILTGVEGEENLEFLPCLE